MPLENTGMWIKENNDFGDIINELLDKFDYDESVLIPNFDILKEIYKIPSHKFPIFCHFEENIIS